MSERIRGSFDHEQAGEIIDQKEKMREISKFFLEYEIMDESCPELSAVRKRHVEKRFGNKLLRLFGRK